MERFNPKCTVANGPESIIQDKILKKLGLLGWYCLETHGNMYQRGFPDIFACCPMYGIRWIEVKLPDMKGSKFTSAQLVVFAKLKRYGVGVWILTSDSDYEIKKLCGPANWEQYALMKML
jgi:hypothetical protein